MPAVERPRARPDPARRAVALLRRRPCAGSRATRWRAAGSRPPAAVARRARQHERVPTRRRQPCAELDRRPVVLGARRTRRAPGPSRRSPDEDRDVAGRSARIVPRRASASTAGRRLDEQQVGVLLRAPGGTMSAAASADVNETERAATPSRRSASRRSLRSARGLAEAPCVLHQIASRAARARCRAASGPAQRRSSRSSPAIAELRDA